MKVVVGVAFEGLEGEGESGVGIFFQGLGGGVSFGFEVVDGLFEEELVEADFDLLRAEDAPGVGGELVGEERLVSILGGEVGGEAFFEGLEVGGAFEGKDGEHGGEAVLESVELGFGFAGFGAGSGGLLRILLTCGALCGGDGAWHGFRVSWRIWVGRRWGDGDFGKSLIWIGWVAGWMEGNACDWRI